MCARSISNATTRCIPPVMKNSTELFAGALPKTLSIPTGEHRSHNQADLNALLPQQALPLTAASRLPTSRRTGRPAHNPKQPRAISAVGQTQASFLQRHHQASTAVGTSGRWGRPKGSFGSEHRWYQPTQASNRAAALTQQALATAAAEQELAPASWLLQHGPTGRAKSAQQCTFGSELRWWERGASGPRSHLDAKPFQEMPFQSPSHAAAHALSQQQEVPHAVQAQSPDGHVAAMLDSEVQWWEKDAETKFLKQGAAATAAASESPLRPAHDIAVSLNHSQRALSVDRGTLRSDAQANAEQEWWKPDRQPSPDSMLQRIQQKHARIQSLAAGLRQRPNSARSHTVKSTCGSEARWWEKSLAYDDAAASVQSFDQQDGIIRASSPDKAQSLRHVPSVATAHDSHSPFRGRSTFGSDKRWWEHNAAALPAAIAASGTAVASESKPRPQPAYSPARQSSSVLSQLQLDSSPQLWPSEAQQPAANAQQMSTHRLHAQPWTSAAPPASHGGSPGKSRGQVRAAAKSPTRSLRESQSSIPSDATTMRRSRDSIRPEGSLPRHSRDSVSLQGGGSGRFGNQGVSQESVSRSSTGGRSRSGSPNAVIKHELQSLRRHRCVSANLRFAYNRLEQQSWTLSVLDSTGAFWCVASHVKLMTWKTCQEWLSQRLAARLPTNIHTV